MECRPVLSWYIDWFPGHHYQYPCHGSGHDNDHYLDPDYDHQLFGALPDW